MYLVPVDCHGISGGHGCVVWREKLVKANSDAASLKEISKDDFEGFERGCEESYYPAETLDIARLMYEYGAGAPPQVVDREAA